MQKNHCIKHVLNSYNWIIGDSIKVICQNIKTFTLLGKPSLVTKASDGKFEICRY